VIGSLITGSLTSLLYLQDPDQYFARSCILYTLAFAPYLFLSFSLDSGGIKPQPRIFLWFLCVVPFLSLVYAPPALSDDVYRYLWEGRAWAVGINPYSTAPAELLGDDLFRQKVNHAELTAVYPPLMQILTACVMAVSYSLFAWKIFLACVFAGGCWGITELLRSAGKAPERVLLFAWNPLVLVEIGGMGHLDLLPAVAILFAVLFWELRRDRWMNFALAVGACTKVFPILLIPLFARGVTAKTRFNHGISLVLGGGVLFIGTLLILQALAPFDSPLDLFRSLSRYAQAWEFNSPVYYGALFLGVPKWIVRIILVSVTVFVVITTTVTSKPETDRSCLCGWIVALWLVCSPVIHPWYIVSLLVFVPLLTSLSWLYLSWSVFLAYSVLPDYRRYGVWAESTLTLMMIWVPCFLLAAYDLFSWVSLNRRARISHH